MTQGTPAPAESLATWPREDQDTLECAPAVLENIRAQAIAGLNRLPHGGLELGGVLFGVRTETGIRIEAMRQFIPEYRFGPSFVLSDFDRERFAALLADSRQDELAALEPVGCWISHTRSGFALADADLDLFDRFFPEPGSVALVVRPANFEPTRAGFFFRNEDGSIAGETPHCEFLLKSERTGHAALDDEPLGQAAVPPESDGLSVPAPSNGGGQGRVGTLQDLEAPDHAPELVREEGLSASPAPVRSRSAARRFSGNAAVLAVFVLAAVAAVLYLRMLDAPKLALMLADNSGQLAITWNGAAIPAGAGASLEISELQTVRLIQLSPGEALRGIIVYARSAPEVMVRFRVSRDGKVTEEVARFIGPAPARAAGERPPEQPEDPPAPPAAVPEAATVAASQQQPSPAANVPAGRADAAKAALPKQIAQPKNTPPAVPEVIQPPLAKPEESQLPAQPPPRAFNPWSALPRRAASAAPSLPPPEQVPDLARPARMPTPELPVIRESKPAYSGPSSGRLIWTGQLSRNMSLAIDGRHSSAGSFSGELPGLPIRITVYPADLAKEGLLVYTSAAPSRRVDPPGPHNGWNTVTWVTDSKMARVDILERPSSQNGWKRLVIRADRAFPILFVDWQLAFDGPDR